LNRWLEALKNAVGSIAEWSVCAAAPAIFHTLGQKETGEMCRARSSSAWVESLTRRATRQL
jgi:hypothetical protein